jgi:hypothetical protein
MVKATVNKALVEELATRGETTQYLIINLLFEGYNKVASDKYFVSYIKRCWLSVSLIPLNQ